MQEQMPGEHKGPLLPKNKSRFAQPLQWVDRGPRRVNSFDGLWEGQVTPRTMTRAQWEEVNEDDYE